MQQSACFVIIPIADTYFVVLFNCTPVDRPSDSMAQLLSYFMNIFLLLKDLNFSLFHVSPGINLFILFGFRPELIRLLLGCRGPNDQLYV